jgi:hypothetical protein
MPLLYSQIDRQGMGTIVVVGLFALSALAFAAHGFVNPVPAVSRNAIVLAADLNPEGQTGCPLGNKSLPTRLTPLP